MQDELRKIAALLREKSKEQGKQRVVKCAQAAQAMIGLATLHKKISEV